MTVTQPQCQMELTSNVHEFYERTGLLWYYKDLESLGFRMFSVSGVFMASSVPALLDFCDRNPCYHVVTIVGPGRYENRYVAGKRLYYLGEGDKNHNLVLDLYSHKNPELFAEELFAKALSMSDDIDGGDQRE